jgi:hypothetical protein
VLDTHPASNWLIFLDLNMPEMAAQIILQNYLDAQAETGLTF